MWSLFSTGSETLCYAIYRVSVLRPRTARRLSRRFFSLFQHLHRGKSRENLCGWLFRVAHNLASRRRYRTRRELESRAEADAGDLAIDPGPSPEAQAVNSQTQQRLLAVVEALPEQCRRCLFLRAKACAIARSPGFSICLSARYPFLWPDLWRASRAPPSGETYELHGFPSFRSTVATGR